jgi:7-cyano-7-deazaguanine synthase
MIDSVAIVSGGMDSVTLLHYLVKLKQKKPAILSFSYGQKHSKEVQFAKYHSQLLGCQEHLILDLSLLAPAFQGSALVGADISIPDIDVVRGDPQPATYVPNRNMIFLSIAAAYAEGYQVQNVYYGAQAHDLYGYWDTTPEFLERINNLLTLNRKNHVQVLAPLVNLTKSEVLRLGLEMNIDYGKTWSCYVGEDKACGICPTCAERLEAFRIVGIKDPLEYEDIV